MKSQKTKTARAPRARAAKTGTKPVPKSARKSAKAAAQKKPPAARKRARPQRKTAALAKTGPEENPKARALAHKIARVVLDKKAADVVVLDVRGIASYTDYVVIASGESDRQVTAMAESTQEKLKADDGIVPLGYEGTESGQWVLLDYGDVVAHLFQAEARAHYDLEGLWADAPRETVV
ncbi:MAG: ribosome silencing factor [Myxococcaceae bacterium]|nr:ribosome silencing factor [Myxococcaceae bacterium]